MSASIWILLAFLAYLSGIVAIGVRTREAASSSIEDFFLGGRRLGPWVVALSAVVSGRSAWLLLGFTGVAYTRGIGAVWAVLGYIVVEAFLFWSYAPRIRRFTGRHGSLTVPGFFAARTGDPGGRLGATLGVVVLVFMTAYTSAQFIAGGKAFAVAFGWDEATGTVVTASIVLLYTLLGGFLAVSWTDVLQAIFMLGVLVVLPVWLVIEAGGPVVVLAAAHAAGPGFMDPLSLGAGALIGYLGIGLGSPGNPHILARYMAIASPDDMRRSAVIGTSWNVLMAVGALVVGLVGRAFFPEVDSIPGADPERLFPALARAALHPALFGLVLASIFAAIMSTADSQLLVGASAVVCDLYQNLTGTRPGPRAAVRMSRVAVFALVVIALGLGVVARQQVFWLVLFAWAGLGSAFGPTGLLALYWRGTTRAGVAAGVFAGAGTAMLWFLTPALKSLMYELVPGFFAGLVATVVVSLLTRHQLSDVALPEELH